MLTTNFLTPNNYSRPQTPLRKVENIVITEIRNFTTANEVRDYLNSLKDTQKCYKSAHYVVDGEGNVVQCIPETECAFAVNGANNNSISIMYIGDITPAMEEAALQICAKIKKEHKKIKIRRDYEITGKQKPFKYVIHPQLFAEFKNKLN